MPQKIVYKVGIQSADDPMEFVMSTNSVDRHGDIVEQSWDLKHFKDNPIALFGHTHSFPIGTWERVRVSGGKLIGKLKLAARGTSDRIDEIRSLVEQRILKAVSVGFIPGEEEALDEDKPWKGLRLMNNQLMECSLVSVPANPDAIATGKALSADMKALLDDATVADDGAFKQLRGLESRGSGITRKSNKLERDHSMSLSDKIEARTKELDELKNQLTDITENGVDEKGDLTDEASEQIEELTGRIERTTKALETLEKAEAGLAVRAKAVQTPTRDQTKGNAAPRIEVRQNRQKGHRAFASIGALIKSHGERSNPVELVRAAYKDEPELEILVRAAVNPADTTDTAWAAPLVRETWGEYIDLIRDLSVYPRLPGLRAEFDRFGKMTLPRNAGRGQLSGGFVGEGSPIPVKAGALDSVDMQPKKLAVISTFTKEVANYSVPAIESLIRGQILGDTAETLDTLFLDAVARSSTRPAGLQDTTETGAGNINAAVGTGTVANVITDATGVLTRVMTARAATSGVWLMNPLRILGLRNKQDAANGEFVFRTELDAGSFMGYPVIASDNVPAGIVAFIGGQAMAFGNDYSPMFDVSDQATLHEEDTSPAAVGTAGSPNVVAAPVRSLFQTDSLAIKMTMGLDWRIIRTGGVQVLTGVAW